MYQRKSIIVQILFILLVKSTISVVSKPNGSPCTVTNNGWTYEGSCLPSIDCRNIGGNPFYFQGNCGVFSSCCTQVINQCGKTSSVKVSYFKNPDVIVGRTDCRHRIKLLNNKVCQIRLDFERFRLAPPTNDKIQNLVTCNNDVLHIDEGTINSFPKICGSNQGQHVFLHLAENIMNVGTIDLFMHLADRNTAKDDDGYPLQQAEWRFKITQLECPNRYATRAFNMTSLFTTNIDFDQIAPANCLQYYTDLTGVFSSFNNDITSSKSLYLTGHNYAICFKRRYPCETLKLQLEQFELDGFYQLPPLCIGAYLGVPEGRNWEGVLVEKICGKPLDLSPKNDLITTTTPGPFFLVFYTAYNPSLRGFRIRYSYEHGMCPWNSKL